MSLILFTANITDPTFKAICKYKDHPSILAIQNNCKKETLRFSNVNIEGIKKDILKSHKNKASQHSDIPIKIIKENLDTFADFLCTNISSSFKSSSFPSCLKMAYVTPLHKKGKKDLKQNFRPVSILPSNILESIWKEHVCTNVASKKAIVHNNAFLALLEKWERAVDSGQMLCALLTDLSKAFDCLYHELLIANLSV